MHLSKIVLVCLSLIAVACADDEDEEFDMTSDEIVEALVPFGDNCEIKPEKEHIKQMIKNDENPHHTSKCFRHCLLKEFEVISENETKMTVDKAVELLSVMFSDGDDLVEIVEKCNGINEGVTEKCENAHQHGMCMLRELKERGYKIPNIG